MLCLALALTGDLLDFVFWIWDYLLATTGIKKLFAMKALFEILVACWAFMNLWVLLTADGSILLPKVPPPPVPGNGDIELVLERPAPV